MKVMKAWNRSLKKETENRVELRFYSGGSQEWWLGRCWY
jgi:hypothetical protein